MQMEITTLIGPLGSLVTALLGMKTLCEQHQVNKSLIQELLNFIQDLQQYTPALEKRFTVCGRDHLGNIMLNDLEKNINEAIEKLNKWSIDRSFFRILNASQRKDELQNMHLKVMSLIATNLGIANVSVVLDVRASQATFMEVMSTEMKEVKSLLTASIESVHDRMLPEVRAQVVEASRSPFADEKFWQDVLAAVDSRYDSQDQLRNLYEDPITGELMIDPIVASNGDTYCLWTIIDNDMKRNPVNLQEALTIVVDNLGIRRGLFVAFPGQFEKFQQRRQEYRVQALSWASDGMLADAEVALQNVLGWDKNDKECAEELVNVQTTLKKAKGKCFEPSPLLTNQDQLSLGTRATPQGRSSDVLSRDSHGAALSNQDFTVEQSVQTYLDMNQNLNVEKSPETCSERNRAFGNRKSDIRKGSFETYLETSECIEYLEFANKLSVKHTGPNDDVATIYANQPAQVRDGERVYYFEMQIQNCGSMGRIAFGFQNHVARHAPAAESYIYVGYSGCLHDGGIRKRVLPYASKYTTGDVVGAGINFAAKEIFFTKNGKLLPIYHFYQVDYRYSRYATILLQSRNEEVKVNFGQEKFVYDLENVIFNTDGSLGTHLDTSMCSENLTVSADKLTVAFKCPSAIPSLPIGAIQANRPTPCGVELYYFEMTIENCGSTSHIALGFTNEDFDNTKDIGCHQVAIGYHGDDGKVYVSKGPKDDTGFISEYASTFLTGDVVGAGINFKAEKVFFTKNGKLLPSVPMVAKNPPYATISLGSSDAKVKVNFGQEKFVFDWKANKNSTSGQWSLQQLRLTNDVQNYLKTK